MLRTGALLTALATLACACSPEAAPPAQHPEASPPAAPAEAPKPSSPYPVAREGDLVETLHGVKVADPYRWLEDLNASETHAWIDAESAYTHRWFEAVPGRDRIARRLDAAANHQHASPPRRRGQRWFSVRNDGQQDQSVLYVADAAEAEGRPLIDFNQISPDGKLGFAGVSVSPRGTYVAYGLSQGGSDWVEWRVREVATGRDLPDRIEWTKYYRPAWAGDEKAFYYSGFPKPPSGKELEAKDLGCAVRVHRLGAGAGTDPVVYERTEHPTWQYAPEVTEDGRYLVITIGDGQVGDRGVEEVHALDLAAKSAKPVPLAEGFDAEYDYVTSEGSTFYFKTSSEAPKGRVIAVDLRTPARSARKTIVPEGAMAISGVARAGDRLLVATLVDATSRLHAYGLDGKDKGEVTLPGLGSAFPVGSGSAERSAYYEYTSFDAPDTTYRLDLATGKSEALHRPKLSIDLGDHEVRQVFYASKDGTRVPMFLVHKKGLVLDGNNPTYLTGYGGFGVPMTPYYDPEYAFWLSIGGVVAIPGLRGGSEYGEAWARAAEKTHKQVTFDDFIAAAEWLVAQKITSPRKLAISGASNGGLLVGAAMTQRPDLFGAVAVEVGVLDMLRFHLAGQGEGWTGFYGSPTVPDEFRALFAYSPLHNVKPGTTYPPTIVITGDHDTRVIPWHSYKFTAALQAAQAGPAPVLLNVRITAGHGGGTTRSAAIRELADKYGFLLKVLDVPPP